MISNGRTETYLKYKELAFDLARARYSVYIHDHRGQGMSPRLFTDADAHDKGHVERFDDYVEDLHAFVGQVVRPEQPGRLFLLAHSMGGGIAARYLQKYPDTFTAAALSSPMLEPNAKIMVSVESSCWWFKHTPWL
ncbi:MAG TPA: alpha/beta fold hydrolase, partial [Ideonella sp.]|nr:alpha/beta fold hydrolase [Ideonella sp.]